MKSTHFEQLAPAAFETVAPNGRIGLVALATDLNSESDLRQMLPPGVDLYTNRVRNANPVTPANLHAMAPDISRAAQDLLPGDCIDVLVYGCTSGTAVIGETQVIRLLQAGRGQLPCTTPITAAGQALQTCSVQRLSILTPYTHTVNQAVAACFQARGFKIINIAGFGIENDKQMTAISADSIYQGALQTCHAQADALFISCTALRAAAVAARIETRLAKPVITSNQAIIWHTLELIGKPYQIKGFGQLFEHRL